MHLLLLLCILSSVTARLTFTVKEGATECFYFEGNLGEKYSLVVDIIGGGSLEIDLRVQEKMM